MNTLGYKFNVVNTTVDAIGKLKYKKIEVSKGNNKLINIKSIKAMAESLQEEAISKNKDIQILIQGVGKRQKHSTTKMHLESLGAVLISSLLQEARVS